MILMNYVETIDAALTDVVLFGSSTSHTKHTRTTPSLIVKKVDRSHSVVSSSEAQQASNLAKFKAMDTHCEAPDIARNFLLP